jgi:hypothetical protein
MHRNAIDAKIQKKKGAKIPKRKRKNNDLQTTTASELFGKAPAHEVLESLLCQGGNKHSRRIVGCQLHS